MPEKTTVGIHLPLKSVTVLRDRYGTDSVYLDVTDELAKKIHGKYYEFFKGASFRLEVTRGRGHEVVEALGITPNLVRTITLDGIVGEGD